MKNTSPVLFLYYLKTCPFCIKVLRAADRLGVDLHLVDIGEERWARQKLLKERGRATVPVLGIVTDNGEELLPESDDIVHYLEQRDGRLAA